MTTLTDPALLMQHARGTISCMSPPEQESIDGMHETLAALRKLRETSPHSVSGDQIEAFKNFVDCAELYARAVRVARRRFTQL